MDTAGLCAYIDGLPQDGGGGGKGEEGNPWELDNVKLSQGKDFAI